MMLPAFNAFQWTALAILLVLFLAAANSFRRNAAARREALWWACLWLAAGVAIAYPRITVVLAKRLGIGRGADLVLYCAVLFMLVGFLLVYVRMRRLNRELALLTRHVALRDAEQTRPGAAPDLLADAPGANSDMMHGTKAGA